MAATGKTWQQEQYWGIFRKVLHPGEEQEGYSANNRRKSGDMRHLLAADAAGYKASRWWLSSADKLAPRIARRSVISAGADACRQKVR